MVHTRAKKMQFMGLWYAREVNLSPDMCRALRTVWRKLQLIGNNLPEGLQLTIADLKSTSAIPKWAT